MKEGDHVPLLEFVTLRISFYMTKQGL